MKRKDQRTASDTTASDRARALTRSRRISQEKSAEGREKKSTRDAEAILSGSPFPVPDRRANSNPAPHRRRAVRADRQIDHHQKPRVGKRQRKARPHYMPFFFSSTTCLRSSKSRTESFSRFAKLPFLNLRGNFEAECGIVARRVWKCTAAKDRRGRLLESRSSLAGRTSLSSTRSRRSTQNTQATLSDVFFDLGNLSFPYTPNFLAE